MGEHDSHPLTSQKKGAPEHIHNRRDKGETRPERSQRRRGNCFCIFFSTVFQRVRSVCTLITKFYKTTTVCSQEDAQSTYSNGQRALEENSLTPSLKSPAPIFCTHWLLDAPGLSALGLHARASQMKPDQSCAGSAPCRPNASSDSQTSD